MPGWREYGDGRLSSAVGAARNRKLEPGEPADTLGRRLVHLLRGGSVPGGRRIQPPAVRRRRNRPVPPPEAARPIPRAFDPHPVASSTAYERAEGTAVFRARVSDLPTEDDRDPGPHAPVGRRLRAVV